jgi:hypothetical protein
MRSNPWNMPRWRRRNQKGRSSAQCMSLVLPVLEDAGSTAGCNILFVWPVPSLPPSWTFFTCFASIVAQVLERPSRR